MIATATEQTPAQEAERTSTPPRPPAFVWKRPFALNDRIGPGTLCVARSILWFDDDDDLVDADEFFRILLIELEIALVGRNQIIPTCHQFKVLNSIKRSRNRNE